MPKAWPCSCQDGWSPPGVSSLLSDGLVRRARLHHPEGIAMLRMFLKLQRLNLGFGLLLLAGAIIAAAVLGR